MFTIKMHLMVLVIIVTHIIVLQFSQAEARPGLYNFVPPANPTGCKAKPEVEELCQQCAKHTKSPVVYPMCCDDAEDARDFCTRFLAYGLH